MAEIRVPTYDALMNPVIQALRSLGGSGTIEEINSKVAETAGLSDEQLEVLHDPEKGGGTEIEHRLGWAILGLRIYGVLEMSGGRVWAFTPLGNKLDQVDEREVVRVARERMNELMQRHTQPEPVEPWRGELLGILLKMEPSAFERLVQRMLRESGFVQVEVTGRTGDGGIDGKGIMRLGGLLSFHVVFQCKRWKGAVGASQVRDFRGALVGRADKGLLITTGTFTKDAMREATRAGAPAIDLIDGDQLLDKLKEFNLGVQTRKVEIEQVTVDHDWFLSI